MKPVIRNINILVLILACFVILVLPGKKEIWYDETISVLCSKGINYDTPVSLASACNLNGSTIQQLNTSSNVFTATVLDNGNSFLYNISLHWFTGIFGNSLSSYMLFSKLCAIASLIGLYLLCGLLWGNSVFTSLAVILLLADNNFTGMSHEVRAYSMATCLVTFAILYCYKFIYQASKPLYLFLTGLFAVAAILSHFLTVYIILVILIALVVTKKAALFSIKNIVAMAIPFTIAGIFFYFSIKGLQVMSHQNAKIQAKALATGFSLSEVAARTMRFTAINFKAVFPTIFNNAVVVAVSFLFIVGLYIASIKTAIGDVQKRNLRLLFILGASGSVFLALLCVKSHHYTALYYRYFSFCIPFATLSIVYALYLLSQSPRIPKLATSTVSGIVLLPAVGLFLLTLQKNNPQLTFNHVAVANQILRNNIATIEVPNWEDALLVQCFLPKEYKINYVVNPTSPNFTLHRGNTSETVPVIRNNG